ncbi:MAG: phosphoribosyl-ATP diphosphatase [Proteobacteria bacterium]|nr:phosphoribosyl-ATP diphosphatase [Pseudomonadota bacterium]MDE3208194.1 phosphoribosyl-ATP diphosphatase [Pseudomonadota bacterium]
MKDILNHLSTIIEARKGTDPSASYVARLLDRGDETIMKKIMEEATEVVLAGKDGDNQHLIHEVADLWFHCLVLLGAHGLHADEVLAELARREGISGLVEKASRGSH